MMDQISTDYGWSKEFNQTPLYIVNSLNKIISKYTSNYDDLILDAGCGGGYLLDILYGKKFKNVRGFDVSETGINVVKEKYEHLNKLVDVHNAYNLKLPEHFPQNNYDLILSIEVIEHLFNPKVYLDNINYWLKNGGYLIISTPYHGFLKNLSISIMNKHDIHYNPLQNGGHIKFFSKNTLSTILNNSSFGVLEFLGSGRIPYLWKSMIVVAKKI